MQNVGPPGESDQQAALRADENDASDSMARTSECARPGAFFASSPVILADGNVLQKSRVKPMSTPWFSYSYNEMLERFFS